jgi:hypothetical protein
MDLKEYFSKLKKGRAKVTRRIRYGGIELPDFEEAA